jgi:hypothetical protein
MLNIKIQNYSLPSYDTVQSDWWVSTVVLDNTIYHTIQTDRPSTAHSREDLLKEQMDACDMC